MSTAESRPVSETLAIVVMGVSGAGKTTVGLRLAEALGADFIDGDDLHSDAARAKMASGAALTDEDRWPWLDRVGARTRRGTCEPQERDNRLLRAAPGLSRSPAGGGRAEAPLRLSRRRSPDDARARRGSARPLHASLAGREPVCRAGAAGGRKRRRRGPCRRRSRSGDPGDRGANLPPGSLIPVAARGPAGRPAETGLGEAGYRRSCTRPRRGRRPREIPASARPATDAPLPGFGEAGDLGKYRPRRGRLRDARVPGLGEAGELAKYRPRRGRLQAPVYPAAARPATGRSRRRPNESVLS